MPLRVAFVHTPMAALIVPERRLYWRNFDARYHGAHPGLRQMRTPRWMLPQWMDSLAGVLVRDGYTDLRVLDLVGVATGPAAVDDLAVTAAVEQSPADVYLLSPVTANLPLALAIARLIKQTTPGPRWSSEEWPRRRFIASWRPTPPWIASSSAGGRSHSSRSCARSQPENA